ncbi:protein-arginine deiminase family protein [Thalassospira tepidiphila]|uniref:protein-arginine deiminase family protein n=1 Tax=Thalassospira tepidiphila TaxID=393657 RepID=UPI0030C6FE80
MVNGDKLNPKDLTVIYYTLHTDRNRDGTLDGAGIIKQFTPPAITFGVHGQGAIIPVNCNRDDNTITAGYADNQDDKVNGNNDLASGTGRIEIRRTIAGPVVGVPAAWELKLEVIRETLADDEPEKHIRVFDGAQQDSDEMIGPETDSFARPTTADVGASKIYAIEAVRFAGRNFANGEFGLILSVIQPEVTGPDTTTYWYTDKLMVARWIGNHHLQTVNDLYVAIANNDDFRTALKNAADADNPAITSIPGDPQTAKAIDIPYLNGNVWVKYDPAGEISPKPAGYDPWMRDTMVSGYSSWPGNNDNDIQTKNTFMKAHRWEELQNWVFETLLSADVGVFYPAAGSTDDIVSGNYGGNIAVTPPVKKTTLAGTTSYRFGRIYYGHNQKHLVDQSSRDFLAAQNMQEPIVLNTDWLFVGHVDEMMTFVPDPNPADPFKKWKLLVASPAEAYRILNDNSVAHGNARMLAKPEWDNVHNQFKYTNLQLEKLQWDNNAKDWTEVDVDVNGTINDFLGDGQAPLHNPRRDKKQQIRYTYKQLRNWNIQGVEAVIMQNIDRLKMAFDLADDDIIKVPVIFYPEEYIDEPYALLDMLDPTALDDDDGFNIYPGVDGGFQCGALTGDMPNMFVGNTRLMIPKPYGPWIVDPTDNVNHGYDLFERDLTQKIATIVGGPTCDFIDDWDIYHMDSGEIHCGTNETRAPFDGQTAFGDARYGQWWTAVDA